MLRRRSGAALITNSIGLTIIPQKIFLTINFRWCQLFLRFLVRYAKLITVYFLYQGAFGVLKKQPEIPACVSNIFTLFLCF